MNQENLKTFGQETAQRKNYMSTRENQRGRGKIAGEMYRSIFTRPEQFMKNNPENTVQEMQKDTKESKLIEVENKIENILEHLNDVNLDVVSEDQENLSSSTGCTVKLRKDQEIPLSGRRRTDLALEHLMKLRESLNSRVDKTLEENQMLHDELKAMEKSSIASMSPRSHKFSSRTHNLDDGEDNLRRCREIVNRLFDQELENVTRNRFIHHSGAGDGYGKKILSRDISPIRTVNVDQSDAIRDIKIQKKKLIESIYVLSQRLNQLESYEKL